jgi:hypothetical protein
MATRYQSSYKTGTAATAPGQDIRVFFLDSEYTGSVTDITLAAPGITFEYQGKGSTNPFDVLKTSIARISVNVSSNSLHEWIIQIGRSNPFRFGVQVYYSGALFWVGYIDPQQISVPYDCPTNYKCQLVATDMIGQLQHVDVPAISNTFDWLQYFVSLYAEETPTRDGLNFYELVSSLPYHIVLAGQITEARYSRYYNRIHESLDWRYNPDQDTNLFNFLQETLGQLNLRIFQLNGILHIIELELYVGATQLQVLQYEFDNTTDSIEYYGTGTLDCTHTPINISSATLQYLPGVNEVTGSFSGDNGSETFSHQNTTNYLETQSFDLNRLDYLTSNYPTFTGTVHLAYAGYNYLRSGSLAFVPLDLPTFTRVPWELRDDLISNGQFSSPANTSGWTSGNGTLANSVGTIVFTCVGSGADGYASITIACTTGQDYVVSLELVATNFPNTIQFAVGTGTGAATRDDVANTTMTGAGMYTLDFTAKQATHYINIIALNTINGTTIECANIKAFNQNTLAPNGQLVAEQRALMQRQNVELIQADFHTWFTFLQAIRIGNSYYLPHRMTIDTHAHNIMGEWFKIWQVIYATWGGLSGLEITVLNPGQENNAIYMDGGTAGWGNLGTMAGQIDQATAGLQFKIYPTEATTYAAAIGLTNNQAGVINYTDLEECFLITSNAPQLRVYHNGALMYSDNYTLNFQDVFRLLHNGRFIEYQLNGATFYRSSQTVSLPLKAMVDFNTNNFGWTEVHFFGNNISDD